MHQYTYFNVSTPLSLTGIARGMRGTRPNSSKPSSLKLETRKKTTAAKKTKTHFNSANWYLSTFLLNCSCHFLATSLNTFFFSPETSPTANSDARKPWKQSLACHEDCHEKIASRSKASTFHSRIILICFDPLTPVVYFCWSFWFVDPSSLGADFAPGSLTCYIFIATELQTSVGPADAAALPGARSYSGVSAPSFVAKDIQCITYIYIYQYKSGKDIYFWFSAATGGDIHFEHKSKWSWGSGVQRQAGSICVARTSCHPFGWCLWWCQLCCTLPPCQNTSRNAAAAVAGAGEGDGKEAGGWHQSCKLVFRLLDREHDVNIRAQKYSVIVR